MVPWLKLLRIGLAFLCVLMAAAEVGLTQQPPTRIFIFAGQSNMVGTHSRVKDINKFPLFADLEKPQNKVLFSYKMGREDMTNSDGWIQLQPTGDFFGPELSFGHRVSQNIDAPVAIIKIASGGTTLGEDWNPDQPGGFKESTGWEPLGPAGPYETFGPELSFAQTLQEKNGANIAIAKFTHSGSQIIDWTPEGSSAKDLNLYETFHQFIQTSIRELKEKGHDVELAGIFYQVGENDTAFYPYRNNAARWLQATITKTRQDLALPNLRWYTSQQPPIDQEGLNRVDVTSQMAAIAEADPYVTHIKAFQLPPQREKLVLDTSGVVEFGRVLANAYLQTP